MKTIVTLSITVLAWVAIGSTLNGLKIITHPAYWSLYGAVFGFIFCSLLNRKDNTPISEV